MNYYGLKLNHNKTLCPFHNDNHPSLTVNHKKNIATCFSCGATGNVISFVQKYEKQINNNDLTVNEAIAKVVEICNLNIDISHLNRRNYNNQYIVSSRKYTEEEQELLKVNEYLGKLFHYNLTAIDRESLNYLHERKIDDKQIKELNLGFAMKGQLLQIAEKNEKIPSAALIELGYLRTDDFGNLYEAFQDRIMIPIHDEKGNIISFCGRTIKDEKPKYLHTAENKLFHKSDLLYNFYNAKTLAYNNELILVEGYMDVAGARRLGFENVVATMGVALTSEQLKLIKRNHSSITLALDNDQAGHDAMIRIIPDLLKQGFKVNVLDISQLGEYKDFGDLSNADIDTQKIQNTKISGFTFLMNKKYFKDKDLNVENISSVYKELKKDKLIVNTFDESLYKEYLINNTNFNKNELDEIMYPKKIQKKETTIGTFTSIAMTNFLYTELLLEVQNMDDKVLTIYFSNHKDVIEEKLVSIFNNNPDKYLNNKDASLNTKLLLDNFLKDNKEYSDYESLNKFKYLNVFDKTYIKNSNGSARVRLKDSQIQSVIKQYEDSLSDRDKLALEEVEELYIVNSLEDIDGILSYQNKSLDILKENIKERLFLNANKMEFFKFGSIFQNVNKDFIDDKFKGRTGNFKTILFYNNLDNKLDLNKESIVNNDEIINKEPIISREEKESEKQVDFVFSINQVLLVPSLETDTHYFVRIPNTEAKEYMFISKEECDWANNGELFYTSLKYGKSYPIYNKMGEYIFDKSFNELKNKWEDKTKSNNTPSNDIRVEPEVLPDNDILYDNTYISKYKDPISKIYKSKIYLETEKGFYIKTNDSDTLLFAVKKICNWTEDKSYLIVNPKKGLFNSGLSKYSLDGFKKTFEKKLSYNEIGKYIKMFYPNEVAKKEIISITIPKYKCTFNSNFIEIPLTIDNTSGFISVNIVKTKINKDSVIVGFSKNDQLVFHDKEGNYISQYSSDKICDSYNTGQESSKVIDLPSNNEEEFIPVYEKEAA